MDIVKADEIPAVSTVHCRAKELTEEQRTFLSELSSELTDKQWKVANILINSDIIPRTKKGKCELLEISRTTWDVWLTDPVWLRVLNMISTIKTGGNLLDIDQAQLKKALDGDTQAARYCRQDVIGLKQPPKSARPLNIDKQMVVIKTNYDV